MFTFSNKMQLSDRQSNVRRVWSSFVRNLINLIAQTIKQTNRPTDRKIRKSDEDFDDDVTFRDAPAFTSCNEMASRRQLAATAAAATTTTTAWYKMQTKS